MITSISAYCRSVEVVMQMWWMASLSATGRPASAALQAYVRAIAEDPALLDALRGNPDLADCHYNLALLCEELGKPKEALRAMAQYRRLIGRKSE